MGNPETKILQVGNIPLSVLKEVARAKAHAQQRKQELKKEFDSRGDVQRHRAMTRDQQIAQARDIMIGKVKTYNDAMQGKDTTQAEAERKVDSLTQRFVRENDDK